MEIPIQNIYYLLCYAWDKLEEKEIVDVDDMESTEILDLFCKVLIGGTTHLLKKGFDRNYITYQEDTGNIKGKIKFNESIKRNLMRHARLNCEFDDLSYNVPHNQILKATIIKLIKNKNIDPELRKELRGLYNYFHSIDDIVLTDRIFGSVQLNRNNYFYDFLLKICKLIYDNFFINEDSGSKKFKDFVREDAMDKLFEAFVRNFYKKEQNDFKVGREDIKWDAESLNRESDGYLPKMQTDISLNSSKRKIIIDTKYCKEALQNNYEADKIKSNNLYQIFSYLKNIESKGGANKNCEGILLYPTVSDNLDLKYKISGHKLNVRTINLNQEWRGICKDLLEIIKI